MAHPFRYGPRALIGYLAFLNAFVPISTDLYLSALPRMTEVFQCPRHLVDLTISGFMLFFALSMLVWGPLSDRWGRKPVLKAGLLLYAAASLVCLFAPTIYVFIFGRVCQAIGSGAVSAISLAIVKDVYRGREVENVLVWMQTISNLAPMVAPILGAFLLQITSWKGLFVTLFLCSAAAFLLLGSLDETLEHPLETGPLATFARLFVVLRIPGLRNLLLLSSISSMPFMAYITSSAFIYITFFGCTEQQFGFYFAVNAIASMAGPLAYKRFLRNMPHVPFLTLSFSVTVLTGIGLLLAGASGPVAFLLLYFPLTFFAAASRPLNTLLILSQVDGDTGSVSSLIGCGGLLFGSIAMACCSVAAHAPVLPVGAMATGIGVLCLIYWLILASTKGYRDPFAGRRR
jgi:DHA1 family bicyclomycin/chloramphenicol resistance-like MFS transporter